MNSSFEKEATVEYNNNIKKYEGYIVKGLYEGRGNLYNKSGDMIYSGFFKKGKFDGFGRKYKENALLYEGYFYDGEYNGVGIFYVNGKKVSKRIYKSGYPLSEGYSWTSPIPTYSKYFLSAAKYLSCWCQFCF